MQTSYSLDEDGMVVLDCERISGNEWVLMLWLLVQAGVKWRESTETEDESLHFLCIYPAALETFERGVGAGMALA